ncbi:MFS transporter [Streptomyces sp. H27-C3]|uniref:MFS transporter n=1 Tax=Streptomyces sp. H27-C3 TaxID=3046305 RepID=UPI0024BBCEB9|nr:MFS transporter [Streptomyces sp. H27-C3]MDJ0462581.1 MFS transporter [Streptomyces sp. H27-C3]
MIETAFVPSRPLGRTRAAWLAGAGVVLIALNLRLGISSASALLDALRTDLGFGSAAVAAMPALPTLSFAAAGFFTGRIVGRLGAERTVLLALAALTAGLTLRGIPATWALLGGTVLAMSGLALCNVLLPTLLRAHFPAKVALLTGVYTTVMALGSTLGAAVAVPLAAWAGSPSLGLAVWALPALLATLVWAFVRAPAARSASASDACETYVSPWAMARTRLGALVTAYFALQALNCYAIIGWLPTMLSKQGMSDSGAGGILAVSQAVGIPATFLVLAFARAPGRLRPAFMTISAAMLAGFTGLLVAPVALPVVWAVLVGLGLCSFPLVLAVIGSSGSSPAETTALSSLSQSLGYLVAALGPFTLGLLRSASGGWTLPMASLLVTAAAQLVIGMALSARQR